MKRRQFLSLSAAGVGLAGLDQRLPTGSGGLYGQPLFMRGGSTAGGENRLRLSLSRMEIPVDAWNPIMQMSRLWNSVLREETSRRAFHASPRRFLLDHGVPPDVMDETDPQFQLLRVVTDPYVRHLAAAGDYPAFLVRLKESGVLHRGAEGALRSRIKAILQADQEALRRELAAAPGVRGPAAKQPPELTEVYTVSRQLATLNDAVQVVAVAAVAVAVAAIVVTLISVAVTVTVGLSLGFAVSVAVQTSVAASGGSCGNCHADLGKVAGLEPAMRRNLETVIRAARLTGQRSFEVEALKDYIATESRACLEAAEELAIIRLPVRQPARDELFADVARLTCTAAGLS